MSSPFVEAETALAAAEREARRMYEARPQRIGIDRFYALISVTGLARRGLVELVSWLLDGRDIEGRGTS